MSYIYVNFTLKSFSSVTPEAFEKNYNEVYKPLLKFLYKNSSLSFGFSFTGKHLEYLTKKHSEFKTVFQELIERNQVEIYGGGFYNPVLPLIQPADRNGQIDKLTSEIRQFTGKRPRGITLFKSIWDSSLVTNFNTCGIEFALVNNSLIPSSKRTFLPLYVSDFGKSLEVFYGSDELKPDCANADCNDCMNAIIQAVNKKIRKEDNPNPNAKRIVNLIFNHKEIKALLSNKWFENFLEWQKNNTESILTTTISSFRKIKNVRTPIFIQPGLNKTIARWIEKPFFETEPKLDYPYTVFDFLESYPRSHALYNRMRYVSMLINSYKGDKIKKNTARERMWEGQNGEALICSDDGIFANSKSRQDAYVAFMEAERIIRDNKNFKESVLSFDYDNDAENEYVCRMNNYFSYISLQGGAVRELQPVNNSGNYADNFSRLEPFDGCTDEYSRGFFIDHVFSEEQFSKYISAEVAGTGIFSKVVYDQIKFSPNRRELHLKATASCSGQKITLLKKYIINSSGMNIQYIIKNESDKVFKSKFCVESNFSNIDFSTAKSNPYRVDVANAKQTKQIDSKKRSRDCYTNGYASNIYIVQITDTNNDISFSFEPNENCNYCFYPLVFKRPNSETKQIAPVGETYVSTLFWDLEMEPGKEIEKNFNFTIYATHKNKKAKN